MVPLSKTQVVSGLSFGIGMALASPFMGFLWAVGMILAQRLAD